MSLMFDEHCCCWSPTAVTTSQPVLPSKKEVQERVSFALIMTPQKIREIEQSTLDQSKNLLWFSVRSYRITASYFGQIFHRRPETPPNSLVLQILGKTSFSSQATNWGIKNEVKALEKYKLVKKDSRKEVTCARLGIVIYDDYPFLGASPDAVVYDAHAHSPFGLVEIKCPFSVRVLIPTEAAESTTFFCSLENSSDGVRTLKLKRTHNYYCQVQGQMAITGRTWCDFVVYTEKGLHCERINYDKIFWTEDLLPRLISFYDNCLGPEIVCPVHVLGMQVRDISFAHHKIAHNNIITIIIKNFFLICTLTRSRVCIIVSVQ